MIVVDTSAIIGILFLESDGAALKEVVAASEAWLPVSCNLEAAITLRKRRYPARSLGVFLAEAEIRLLPSDEHQARLAVEADWRYGKGTRHPAQLNFGDCLAYAAAMAHDAPLLFKGGDFGHTDVKRAL